MDRPKAAQQARQGRQGGPRAARQPGRAVQRAVQRHRAHDDEALRRLQNEGSLENI